MIAPVLHFIYRGGGRDEIPNHVTHVTTHESVTFIHDSVFESHPNIVELICHENVKRIEFGAFGGCPRLRRVVMPGVEVAEGRAFNECRNLLDVECDRLETIQGSAFSRCISLRDINLPSARIVEGYVFYHCPQLNVVTFGKNLESIGGCAFCNCPSLELITIPLKSFDIAHDAFDKCVNLNSVGIVDGDILNDTVAALPFDEWRDDMIVEIESIFHDLQGGNEDDISKTYPLTIMCWAGQVLRKIIDYKAKHRGLLNALETSPSLLQLPLPDDVVRNHVLPLLKLPSYAFDGEDENQDEYVVINPSMIELAWTRALVWPTATESDVTAAEVDTIDEGGNKNGWLRSFLTPLVIFVVMVTILSSAKNLHVSDIIALMILYRMNLIVIAASMRAFFSP